VRPDDVPDSVVERATAGLTEAMDLLTGAQIGELPYNPDPLMARAAIAAVASIEEVWEMGPDARPVPFPAEIRDGIPVWPDGSPFVLTADYYRAAGWKLRRRLVTDWVDA
jgi:hypothetical protein